MNYESYFDKMDELAEESFKAFEDAEVSYKAAKERAAQYPMLSGIVPASYRADAARAQADLIEAEEGRYFARKKLETALREVEKLRDALSQEIASKTLADPSQVDDKAMTLIRSGIMGANDYRNLLNQAKEGKNCTMARLLAKYAAEAAEAAKDTREARELRRVATEARQSFDAPVLSAFDSLSGVFTRCVNNPAMMKTWGEFSEQCRATAESGNE